jgi:hypothetical protein
LNIGDPWQSISHLFSSVPIIDAIWSFSTPQYPLLKQYLQYIFFYFSFSIATARIPCGCPTAPRAKFVLTRSITGVGYQGLVGVPAHLSSSTLTYLCLIFRLLGGSLFDHLLHYITLPMSPTASLHTCRLRPASYYVPTLLPRGMQTSVIEQSRPVI